MLAAVLWPPEAEVQVKNIELADNSLIVTLHGTQLSAMCPACDVASSRRHGSYRRCPLDLPCVGYPVQVNLLVSRFFCDNEICPRRTFAARFPAFVAPYARRTRRLYSQQQQLGFSITGEGGAGLLAIIGMPTSPDTLLRTVRAAPEAESSAPRIIGIDDWAKRKGKTYGTIVVDLETHQVIDLLPDRTPQTVAEWLETHPSVEIVSRDRGADYIAGVNRGAPGVVQIADRFHLVQNTVDALKRVLEQQGPHLRAAAHNVAQDEEVAPPIVDVSDAVPSVETSMRERIFHEVKVLQAEGHSRRQVAQQLNLNRRTVASYFAQDTCPVRESGPQSTSNATPYLPYLAQRWQAGCQSVKQLYLEVREQGFDGHYASIYRAIKRLLTTGELERMAQAAPKPVPRLAATTATWLLLQPADQLTPIQGKLRDQLCLVSAEIKLAAELAHSFCQILRDRAADQFEHWLSAAEQSGIAVFVNLAGGFRRDHSAIKAAFTYEWSNGPVEGHVNRLKCIKWHMYGRANFDLLRKRVLGPPIVT